MRQGSWAARQSESAGGVVFAVAFLVAITGVALLVGGVVFETRSTVPGLGLLLVVVGLLLCYEFGVRPARRNNRGVLVSLRDGLNMLGRWSKRMAGVGKR